MSIQIEREFNKFLSSSLDRCWIEGNYVKAYFRKSHRYFVDYGLVPTLDLASVQVGNGLRERTGRLRPLFRAMEAQQTYKFIYIENCNLRMRHICRKNKYIELPTDFPDLVSFFKPLKQLDA